LELRQRIKLLLKASGYTQLSAAKKLGVARITIHRYLNGHTDLKSTDFCNLVKLLGFDVAEEIEVNLHKVFPKNVKAI